MSTPEQEEKVLNDPKSCARECMYRGVGVCSFESCPFDEFPMHHGQYTTDKCVICGASISRCQLDNDNILCSECQRKLYKTFVTKWSTLEYMLDNGRGPNCPWG